MLRFQLQLIARVASFLRWHSILTEAYCGELIIEYADTVAELAQDNAARGQVDVELDFLLLNLLREQCLVEVRIDLHKASHRLASALLRRHTACHTEASATDEARNLQILLHLTRLSIRALRQLEECIVTQLIEHLEVTHEAAQLMRTDQNGALLLLTLDLIATEEVLRRNMDTRKYLVEALATLGINDDLVRVKIEVDLLVVLPDLRRQLQQLVQVRYLGLLKLEF